MACFRSGSSTIIAAIFLAATTRRDSTPVVLTALLGVTTAGIFCSVAGVASMRYH